MTNTAQNVLKYIDVQNNQHNWHNHAIIPDEIEDAVRSLWDGRPQSQLGSFTHQGAQASS